MVAALRAARDSIIAITRSEVRAVCRPDGTGTGSGMFWLLVALAWTFGAVVMAPLVGRLLGHADVRRTALPSRHRPLGLR